MQLAHSGRQDTVRHRLMWAGGIVLRSRLPEDSPMLSASGSLSGSFLTRPG
jgi:hypothetical protein